MKKLLGRAVLFIAVMFIAKAIGGYFGTIEGKRILENVAFSPSETPEKTGNVVLDNVNGLDNTVTERNKEYMAKLPEFDKSINRASFAASERELCDITAPANAERGIKTGFAMLAGKNVDFNNPGLADVINQLKQVSVVNCYIGVSDRQHGVVNAEMKQKEAIWQDANNKAHSLQERAAVMGMRTTLDAYRLGFTGY